MSDKLWLRVLSGIQVQVMDEDVKQRAAPTLAPDHTGMPLDVRRVQRAPGVPGFIVTKRMPDGYAISATGESRDEATEQLLTYLVRLLASHGATRDTLRAAQTEILEIT